MINKSLYLHLRNHKKIKVTKQEVLIIDQSIEIEAFWSSKTLNRKWTGIDPHLITVISMY